MSIFPLEKREKIRITMLEVGIRLIKEMGLQNVTVSEISKQTGIGKGTFYHFYKSKELFLFEVISYSKENIFRELNRIIEDNNEISRLGFEQLFQRFSFMGESNIIHFINAEDEMWLAKKLPEKFNINSKREEEIIQTILKHIKNRRDNINFHVLANMMKIMALVVENKEHLHQDVLEENMKLLFNQLLDYIFVEGEDKNVVCN